jgi:hypothetical protein
MLTGTTQQLLQPVVMDATCAVDEAPLPVPADHGLAPPLDDSMPDPPEDWPDPEATAGEVVPEGEDLPYWWQSWTECMSRFRPLIHREELTLVCPVTLSTQCWSKLKCPSSDGAPCCITVHQKQLRKVHGYTEVMLLTMPRLRCTVHYSNPTRGTPCTFRLTDAQVWRQVEDMQRKGDVIVSPRIVVISEKLILTMEAYMYEPFLYRAVICAARTSVLIAFWSMQESRKNDVVKFRFREDCSSMVQRSSYHLG